MRMKRFLAFLIAISAVGCEATRTMTREQVESTPLVVPGRYVPVPIAGSAPLYARVVDENPNHENAIVLLHALASSIETWAGWAQELKKEHRVIRIDLPGSGLTGARADRDYSVVADAAAIC